MMTSHTNPSAPGTTRRREGFTIVEILVVITIISLLISMLLPVMSQARGSATHIRCASQMHQHGVAMTTYQTDFKGYYPSFGGDVANDYSNWYRTGGNANGAFWQINYNPGTLAYFSGYLNAGITNGSIVSRQAQQIDFCPAIDWLHWQNYVFTGSGYQFSYFQKVIPNSATASWAGYNFYPGQKFYAPSSYSSDYDTRPRREDPRELLMTDLVSKIQNSANTGSSVYNGQTLSSTINIPWFNPHSGNGATVTPQDAFHQMSASGAVTTQQTSAAKFTNNWGSGGTTGLYSNATKTAANATGDSPDTDGPYFRVP